MENFTAIKAQLEADLAKSLAATEELRLEAEAMMDNKEAGTNRSDANNNEGDNLSVDVSAIRQIAAQHEETTRAIQEALARIERGTYGICSSCKKPIAAARLEVLPFAELCAPCASGANSRLGMRR